MEARFKKVLALTDEEKRRYGVPKDRGTSKIGLAFLLARNVLAADAGARFLWVANTYNGGNGPADNHDQLYGRGALAPKGAILSIYESGPRLDAAFSSLVQDLSTMPGHESGKTLLDETMICLVHEFGRNPEMNANAGRDHWGPCFANLFMGGGVKPGRVIGKTDGYKVLDVGWNHKEQPMMDHRPANNIYLDSFYIDKYEVTNADYARFVEATGARPPWHWPQGKIPNGEERFPVFNVNW